MKLSKIRQFLRDKRANISIIFALSALPLIFVTGMGVDYTTAADRQAQLNADADAAALAAVTNTVSAQSDTASVTAATNTFNAQATTIPGVTYDPANLSVSVVDSATNRTVTVSYTAASQNAFLGVLGTPTIALSGTSTATSQSAPNVDFYLLLDSSPSMAIASTQTGINTMVSNTSSQGGCAFGCHESHPSSDNLGNPGGEDNYQLARNLGVTLREDVLASATSNLMTTAQSEENSNNATYRMAIYTFDVNFNRIQTLTSSLSTAQSAAGNISMLEVYANNWLTSSNKNNDADTNVDNALNSINATMPNPGNGSNATGDTPQEVLFWVTDGVEDELVNGSRQQSVINTSWCTTIKNRGIRIAVLYTEYLPLPTNSWYNTWISPFQPNIGPTLQSCASSGLYFEVQTGQDISAAMSALFQAAVQTAHLTH
jgi:Flp pilus assembly protein TadG